MQYVVDPEYVKAKYNLPMLREVENLVADAVQISVPFNNPITGFCAFTHKAGIHAKAILANPSTYEILKPEDFGMSRCTFPRLPCRPHRRRATILAPASSANSFLFTSKQTLTLVPGWWDGTLSSRALSSSTSR